MPYFTPVRPPKRLARAYASIRWGATLSALGVALSLWGNAQVGGMLVLAGMGLSVFGLHHLGRAGPAG